MKNITRAVASIALLTAPVTMTAIPQSQANHAPQYMASTVLASLGMATTPDHNVHASGCGCAACQSCQIVDPTTI
jgi:hypothetical protein